MRHYSIEPRPGKNAYGFLSFARKYKKQLLETRLNASKKVVIKQVNLKEVKLQTQSLSQTMIKLN